MEDELREAFRDQREATEEAFREQREATERGFERMGTKVDAVRADLHTHQTESATRSAQVESRSRAAHHRLDEHAKEHLAQDHKEETKSGRRWELVVALIIASLSGLGTLVIALYQLFKTGKP